jgi:glycolate oxidase iron-sulfur subunit
VDLFANRNLDYIVTDCAACGAELKGYGRLLADDSRYARRAVEFSARVRDISELLVEIGVRTPEGQVPARVTYDDPCHLCHAQGIRAQPRDLIRAVPGVRLIELEESDWCCGSAGVYNVTHAARAERILDRKLEHVAESRANILATGNPGCLLQLRAGVRRAGLKMEVLHPVQILDRAYGRERVRGGGDGATEERTARD